jgi:hypothetical protein
MTTVSVAGPPDLLLSLAALVALGAFFLWQGRRRRLAMIAAAKQLGFAFEGDPGADAMAALARLRALADVPLLSRGFRQWAANGMAGRRNGRDVRVFDFHYRHRARGRGTTALTVVLVPGAGAGLPDFVLAPENVFQKLGELFGGADIDFLTHPAFSERYLLRGSDEPAIRRAFRAEALETIGRERGWHVEVARGHLAAYCGTTCISPGEVPELVDRVLRIVELLARE